MRFGKYQDVFDAAWEDVTIAWWHKYPNPNAKHVLAEDIVERFLDPQTQFLHTTRILRKKSSKPKWMDPFIGESPAYVVEVSVIDPHKRVLATFTKNVTLTRFMVVEEACLFRASPSDPQSTLRAMSCKVTSPMFTLGSLVEKFGFERFQRHKDTAREGLNLVLARLQVEGRLVYGRFRLPLDQLKAQCLPAETHTARSD